MSVSREILKNILFYYYPWHVSQANAVIAFNNKPAADAVPYFEQVCTKWSALSCSFFFADQSFNILAA